MESKTEIKEKNNKLYYRAYNYWRCPHFLARIEIIDSNRNILARISTSYPTLQKATKKQLKLIKDKIKELGFKEDDLFDGYIV